MSLSFLKFASFRLLDAYSHLVRMHWQWLDQLLPLRQIQVEMTSQSGRLGALQQANGLFCA